MKICFPRNKVNYDWESLLRSYQNHVSKEKTVLEIGASNVARTRELSKLCRKLIGVEIFLERKPDDFENVEYVTGDWQRLSEFMQPSTIDLAVSSHVIEHVEDDLRAMNELYEVLRPGGVALLNTPNRKRLVRAVIETFTGEKKFPFWEHVREYVEEDLLELMNSSRFERFAVFPVVLGLHGGPIFFYLESVPHALRRYANFWEIHLFKERD